jgi:inositol polyphosphate-4-phosphatase
VLEFNKEYFKGTNTGSSAKALRIDEDSGFNFGEDNQLMAKFIALKEAIGKGKKPEKHVDILYKSSILCRELGGTIALLCKSGKDRTSMAVTLDSTRDLVERMGVVRGEDLLRVKRTVGVRRMNVYANTGQSNYAFNGFQVNHFPKCYQAPSKTYAGNVAS